MSNDRQVIDLHWLHCRNGRLRGNGEHWRSLLEEKTFDFDLASQFVATVRSVDAKVTDALRLPQRLQWQLAALQSKALADKWRLIEKGRPGLVGEEDVRDALVHAALDTPAITAQIDTWTLIWKCWRLTGDKSTLLAELTPYRLFVAAESCGSITFASAAQGVVRLEGWLRLSHSAHGRAPATRDHKARKGDPLLEE